MYGRVRISAYSVASETIAPTRRRNDGYGFLHARDVVSRIHYSYGASETKSTFVLGRLSVWLPVAAAAGTPFIKDNKPDVPFVTRVIITLAKCGKFPRALHRRQF